MDLFFLICYLSTLLTSVNSYVLLAANLEDFKTMAKKLVPKDLAEQIVQIAQGSAMNSRKETVEYSDESQPRNTEHSYELTTGGYKRGVPVRNVPRFEMNRAPPATPGTPIAAAPLISIDEIVEKVKQRLQSELLSRGSLDPDGNVRLARFAPPSNPVYNYKTPVNEEQMEIQYEDDNANVDVANQETQNPFQQKHIVGNKYPLTQNVYMNPHQGAIIPVAGQKNVRYPHQITVQPNKQQQIMLQQQTQQPTKIGLKQNLVKKKQLVRFQSLQPAQITSSKKVSTTEGSNIGIFEAVDMLKENDSYEDYVTPAKEEAFESEIDEPSKFVSMVITLNPKPIIRTTTLASRVRDAAGDNAQIALEYEYETSETTMEPKAKTESISYEEKEIKPDPNVTATAHANGKLIKKIKMGTMIPTRETYKINSPNYYAKLPTIAEKYNFNEPIPERDREPENLKPIGNPPASINGKVALLK